MSGPANPRRAAWDMLLAVERGGYANLVVKQTLTDAMRDDERSFAAALLYTVLDHLIAIDFIVDSFAKGRLQMPVRCVLRLGVCQLLYMNVPESAACNESVKLVRDIGKPALAGFVNGTMRAVARAKDNLPKPQGDRAQVLSITYSWPLWIVREWIERFGEVEAEAMLAYRAEPSLTIRSNPFKAREGEVETALNDRGIAFSRGAFATDALKLQSSFNVLKDPLFEDGKYAVQGESSMLVCRVADPKPGMRILDACAAPGGKSLYLAALIGRGEIIAWDIHEHRVGLIAQACDRLGVDWIRPAVQDATQYRPQYDGAFDVVLVDAPCSGLGVVGGKPDIKYAKTKQGVDDLVGIQREILSACSRYVRPGGALVYATCTISKEENENNVAWFLQRHSDFTADDVARFLPAGVDRDRARGGMVQLFPHRDGVDGFFVARMVRS